MSLELILTILCLSLVFIVAFLCKKIYEFSMIIFDLEDQIEECLDLLDKKYQNMTKILEKPIFFDSVEVRQVISDISDCRAAVLEIANKLTRKVNFEANSEPESKEESQ